MADKKIYNFNGIQKISEGKFMGAIEGLVISTDKIKPTVRTVNVQGNSKKVCNFRVFSGIASSKLKFLGLPEGDTLWLSVSAWERLADRLEKLNLRKGHRLILFGTIEIKETENGKFAEMLLNDFKVLSFPKDGVGSNQTSEDTFEGTESDDCEDIPF